MKFLVFPSFFHDSFDSQIEWIILLNCQLYITQSTFRRFNIMQIFHMTFYCLVRTNTILEERKKELERTPLLKNCKFALHPSHVSPKTGLIFCFSVRYVYSRRIYIPIPFHGFVLYDYPNLLDAKYEHWISSRMILDVSGPLWKWTSFSSKISLEGLWSSLISGNLSCSIWYVGPICLLEKDSYSRTFQGFVMITQISFNINVCINNRYLNFHMILNSTIVAQIYA